MKATRAQARIMNALEESVEKIASLESEVAALRKKIDQLLRAQKAAEKASSSD